MAVGGWLLLGPRGLVSWRVVWLSLVYPIAWLVFTLVRGAAIGWYPYPFMDPREQGYASVSFTLAGIVAAFIALAALLLLVDRALGRPGTAPRARGRRGLRYVKPRRPCTQARIGAVTAASEQSRAAAVAA